MHVVRLDLLGRLPVFKFVVTPDMIAEIVLPDQKQQVDNAVAGGILRVEGLSRECRRARAVCRVAAPN